MAAIEERLQVPQHWYDVAACVDRYEDAAVGELPKLSDLLQSAEPDHRTEALVELVLVDREYRRRRGQEKPLDDYLKEFPELAEFAERLLEQAMEADGAPSAEPRPTDRHVPGSLRSTMALKSTDTRAQPPTKVSAPAGTRPGTTQRPQIGDYLVSGSLGHGAYGIVYRCWDPALQRDVAIKVANESAFRALDRREAFHHEARSVAALRHPNIVGVLAFGETEDARPYIVYEYISGTTLSNRIRQQDYTIEEGVEWVAAVADALHEAHRSKIIHRDVKSANILIDDGGSPRLTDFGLARRNDGFFVDDRGKVVGTSLYASPEQASKRSDWASPASDIYSLGVVLYEVLCSQLPFRPGRLEELLEQVQHRQPDSPRALNDRIPAAVEDVCLKALSKAPADRYRTAKDMAAALRAAVRPRKPRLPLIGFAASLVSLAAVLAWNLLPTKPLPALEVTKLGVYIRPQGTSQSYRLPENGPPQPGDTLGLHGELNRAAYHYVFLFQDSSEPKLLSPAPEDVDNPQRKRCLDLSEYDREAIRMAESEGVVLVLYAATDKPLSRADVKALCALQLELPPPIWDRKLHLAVKPPRPERTDEDIRGGGGEAKPFKIPQEIRDFADWKFHAYEAIMFPHCGHGDGNEAKPQP
jgi:serine/threonine protein kinase